MKPLIALVLLVLGVGCRVSDPESGPLDVSLVQLIATPQQFDGKLVRFVGFCRLEFEGNAVYLHQDDYTHFISHNGLWLEVTEAIERRRTELDQKYVLIEGVFNAKDKGHMDGWSGSIQKIKRLERGFTRSPARAATLDPTNTPTRIGAP